jgi:hypothetical protein
MTFVMVDYHGHIQPLADVDDAGEWFDEQAGSILPTGGSGQVIWYGPSGRAAELRVDIDVDADAAALTWMPTGAHTQRTSTAASITVLVTADGDEETIAASRACLGTVAAREAVLEYVSTGERPVNVPWAEGS